MDSLLKSWKQATGDLPWGVQSAMHDAISLVAEEKVSLTFNANYASDGTPCLVNSIAQMLTHKSDGISPTGSFPVVVSLWDQIHTELRNKGVNNDGTKVSPLAAEILLKNFGDLKEKPVSDAVSEAMAMEAFGSGAYREPSDEEMARDWLNSLHVESAQRDFEEVDGQSERR